MKRFRTHLDDARPLRLYRNRLELTATSKERRTSCRTVILSSTPPIALPTASGQIRISNGVLLLDRCKLCTMFSPTWSNKQGTNVVEKEENHIYVLRGK